MSAKLRNRPCEGRRRSGKRCGECPPCAAYHNKIGRQIRYQIAKERRQARKEATI